MRLAYYLMRSKHSAVVAITVNSDLRLKNNSYQEVTLPANNCISIPASYPSHQSGVNSSRMPKFI